LSFVPTICAFDVDECFNKLPTTPAALAIVGEDAASRDVRDCDAIVRTVGIVNLNTASQA